MIPPSTAATMVKARTLALDYFEVASLFSQVLGRKTTYKNPSTMVFLIRQLRKSSPGYALVTTWLYANTRSGMAERVTGEVRRLTGREPISMHQYIQDYRDHWEKTHLTINVY
jgi:hypothetical protein